MKKNKSLLIPIVEVLSKGISFINLLLFVHILSVDDYADYSYIIAVVLWASVIMDGGINNLIYNNSLKNETKDINKLYTSRLFLSLVVIGVLCLLFSIINPDLIIPVIIFSFVTYFSTTTGLVKMLSRGLGFVKVDIISIISEPLFRLIFLTIIYFTRFNYNLWNVLLVYLFASLIAYAINLHFLNLRFYLKIRIHNFNIIGKNIFNSLKKSKYYLLYYLMYIGIARVDMIFLESYSNKTQVAIFGTVLNLYQVAQLFFISVITSQFINLNKNRKLVYKVLTPLLILAIVATNLASPFIYTYLFPADYINGKLILNTLIIALLPSIINYYYIVKNNYYNKMTNNFIILLIIFTLKSAVYVALKPSDLMTYTYIIITTELVIFFLFHLILKHESITNK